MRTAGELGPARPLAWRDARLDLAGVYCWRTAVGDEVDFVIEARDRPLPVEIKATRRLVDVRVRRCAWAGLRREKGRPGFLLHTPGDLVDWIAPDVLAAPWWRVI